MRFAAVQFDIIWEDKPANHAVIERMLREAGIAPGTFVVLPELGDTGFSMNLDRIIDDLTLPWAADLARRMGIFLQSGFAERGADGKGRNTAAIVGPDGSVIAKYHKVHPFSYGKESTHYSGGDRIALASCGDFSICPAICYDLRFPELWRLAALAGAEVFTIGASWPAARTHHWRSLLIARAIENQAFIVACNRVGNDPTLAYSGNSMIISPKGEVLIEADDQPRVIQAELNPASLRAWRAQFPALADVRRDLLGTIPVERTPAI